MWPGTARGPRASRPPAARTDRAVQLQHRRGSPAGGWPRSGPAGPVHRDHVLRHYAVKSNFVVAARQQRRSLWTDAALLVPVVGARLDAAFVFVRGAVKPGRILLRRLMTPLCWDRRLERPLLPRSSIAAAVCYCCG